MVFNAFNFAFASNVVISEICWMGTTNSSNDEWIELFNNSDSEADLSGWTLKTDKTPNIALSGKIAPKSFYLLERTDDNSAPRAKADQIYTGALLNSGENLILYDKNLNIVEQVNCSSGWFSGDNGKKMTMERISPFSPANDSSSWQTSQNQGGTPKAQNSSGLEQIPINEKIPANPNLSPIAVDFKIADIIINEVMPSPEGPDSKNEWFELFNNSDFEADLSGWLIRDLQGKTKNYYFPKATKIPANGFAVFKSSATKISLNNSGDGLELISPDKKIADSVSFEKASQGSSYNRVNSNWQWSKKPTPESQNIISNFDKKKASDTKKEVILAESEKNLPFSKANISQNTDKILYKTSAYIIAVFLALFSAVIAVILKIKIDKNKII